MRRVRLPRQAVRQVRRAPLATDQRRALYRLLEACAAVMADVHTLVVLARLGVKVLTGRLHPSVLDVLVGAA